MSEFALNVKGDMKAVLRDLRHVDGNLKRRAAVAGLNKSITAVRGAAVKKTAAKINVKQKLLTQRSRIQRAKQTFIAASVYMKQAGISLSEIGNIRQMKSGVAVGRRRFPGMFYAEMPAQRSGRRHGGVFFRVPNARKRTTSKGRYAGTGIRRQPIKEKLIWHKDIFDEVVKDTIQTVGRARFEREFERWLRWKLK